MTITKSFKINFIILGLLIISNVGYCQQKPTVEQKPSSDAGFDRTVRKGEANGPHWAWGTMGHGSYDQTIELFKTDEFFKPDKDVKYFKQGKVKYRIFTYSNINYIEVDYGWTTYTYVTK